MRCVYPKETSGRTDFGLSHNRYLTVQRQHKKYQENYPDGYGYTQFKKAICDYQYSHNLSYHNTCLSDAELQIDFAGDSLWFTELFEKGGGMSANSASAAEHKEIAKGIMEFMYDYRFLRDTIDITSESTDRMILQVGYGISKFSSYRAMQIDSLLRVSTTEQIEANPDRYIGGETYSIYKNYPTGKFTMTDKIATDWFLVEELIPEQQWTLTDETKEILGYQCKSAKCSFRGREYTAYYTDEIPVADGPWKFGGLPGFIMEVRDADNHYSFTCVGINSKADRSITIPEVQYNKTSRVKFYQAKHRYDTNPLGYLETVSGIKVNVTSNGEARKDLNKPRELTYDYIETDWKNY